MTQAWRIEGARAPTLGAAWTGTLALADGRVAARAPANARRFDASGLLVLPGVVDLHGDAHERALQPRPGVDMPVAVALRESAAAIAAAGITTAYLGVTLSWEGGLRGDATWRALRAALPAIRAETPIDLRVHLRFEVDHLDAESDATAALRAGEVHLLGLNDHTPAIVRRLDTPVQLGKYAERAGRSVDDYAALARRVAARRDAMPAARARLAAAAAAAGVPIASHDDADLDARALHRALGARLCEFPMSEAVASDARAAGEAVLMGAPNVLRGGSHLGWASAAPLAEAGIVDVLVSDYHYPAPLLAAFVLAGRGVLDLPAAWALVAANPARAAGLADRGGLTPGLRGDVVLVDPAGPASVATFAAGRLAHLAPAGAERLRG